MIISRLAGGLGNQMFEYAAGLRLAAARKSRLKLDLSALSAPTVTPRVYELGAFSISAALAAPDEIASVRKRGAGLLGRLAARWSRSPSRSPAVEETFGFDPRVLSLPDNVYLRGHWQSERYFADVAELVRREFSWKREPAGRNAEAAAEISACNAVSLHVRRGDYVSNQDALAMHGVCSIDYYERAVAHIADRVSDPIFFLFSDDREWVQEHLKLRGSVRLMDHNGPGAGAEDLRLMARCAHHVIANSTFSWWGAWLDPNPEKIVVAPERWFADDSLDTSDLLPASWVKL